MVKLLKQLNVVWGRSHRAKATVLMRAEAQSPGYPKAFGVKSRAKRKLHGLQGLRSYITWEGEAAARWGPTRTRQRRPTLRSGKGASFIRTDPPHNRAAEHCCVLTAPNFRKGFEGFSEVILDCGPVCAMLRAC
jgi:hypothetical protein